MRRRLGTLVLVAVALGVLSVVAVARNYDSKVVAPTVPSQSPLSERSESTVVGVSPICTIGNGADVTGAVCSDALHYQLTGRAVVTIKSAGGVTFTTEADASAYKVGDRWTSSDSIAGSQISEATPTPSAGYGTVVIVSPICSFGNGADVTGPVCSDSVHSHATNRALVTIKSASGATFTTEADASAYKVGDRWPSSLTR